MASTLGLCILEKASSGEHHPFQLPKLESRREQGLMTKNSTFHRANIPDDLSSLLRTVGAPNLLDFSLGSGGRYYVKYIAEGREKRSEPSHVRNRSTAK